MPVEPLRLLPCLQIVSDLSLDFERPPGGFEELWCYCNTLNIFEQCHIAERIA